ncbi:UNVERIFIED_CONTAM: hypothetical protein PYX00_011162 [Menopon gallinae]|uniref:S1 motif domain-containing protein n=1 Tax=Menopon gallinae TaxID=328185 RepID=A0AAW2H648_9NEOP
MTNQQPNFSSENFEELFNQSISNVNSFNSQLVKGKVIKTTDEYVIVDVGLKSEGRIPKSEFVDENGNKEELKEGDIIEVYIDRYENKDGSVVLSKERAYREENWHKLELLYKEGTQIEGHVTKRVKGGFMVLVKNTVAFLPGSQLDIRPIKNVNSLVDTIQTLKILSMDRKRYNIVVSRRAVIEDRLKEEGVSLGKKFTEGQIVEGVVKNITGYGCFVDLGTRDGLLHIIDVSWSRINHPSEVLKVGQVVKVKIIKIHPENDRISLVVEGEIKSVDDSGIVVKLSEDIQGFIRHYDISWENDNKEALESYKSKVGEKIEAKVLKYDLEREKLYLGLKQFTEDPFSSTIANLKKGDVVKGIVAEVTENVISVKLEEDNISAIIKKNELSLDKEQQRTNNYNVGDKISAMVVGIDKTDRTINLSIKALEQLDHKKYLSEQESVSVSIGDILHDAINKQEKNK